MNTVWSACVYACARVLLLLTQIPSFYVAQGAIKATFLASAIRKCGGNEQKGSLLYTAYGSSGQVCFSILLVSLLGYSVSIITHAYVFPYMYIPNISFIFSFNY
jgi:hypothetical protein